MSPAAISFLVLGAVVVLFVWNRLPVELVALGAAVTLYFTGVNSLPQTFGGFGDPVVIFIAALFVVSAALDASGATAWAGQQLMHRAGTPQRKLLLTLLLTAGLTALISVNGAVAALLPMVVIMAVRSGRSPSKMMMPIAFAAHAGSLLLLTGTPINVLVAEAASDGGGRAFGFFEYALAGIPLLVGTIAIIMLLGRRLLPDREPHSIPPDLSQHARTLASQYSVSGSLITPEVGVAEVVVSPRSALVGSEAFPGMVTDSGDLIVLAVQRQGSNVDNLPTSLAVGDVLLLQGTWRALDQNIDADPGVIAVNPPEAIRAQAAPLGAKGKKAMAVLGVMVVLLATGVFPIAITALLAAGAMVLLGVLTMPRAFRGINWTTVIIVGAMIPLSTAIQQSGAADIIASALVRLTGGSGPYVLLLGIFLFTAILGQMISNTATALIIIPIAVAAATELHVSIQPVLMCVAIAAAASFLTPVATPANMMVKGPGGYRFGDYWKLGLPILAWFGIVAVLIVPVFWRFQ